MPVPKVSVLERVYCILRWERGNLQHYTRRKLKSRQSSRSPPLSFSVRNRELKETRRRWLRKRHLRIDFALYYIHFEITGDRCNLIGSEQCDLFTNHTIFCSKSHVLNRVNHILNCLISVFNCTIFALYCIISVSATKRD